MENQFEVKQDGAILTIVLVENWQLAMHPH